METVSGELSSDFRDIEDAMFAGNERARIAMETYSYRLAKYIGAYITALGGCDAITFTAGVGEYGPVTRGMVLNYFKFLGDKIDEQLKDKILGQQTVISTPDSTIKVAVVPTNEERAIARDTLALVG